MEKPVKVEIEFVNKEKSESHMLAYYNRISSMVKKDKGEK